MNRGQIRTLVRESINESGAAGFWTDANLNTYIDIANAKLNSTIAALDEDFFTVSATFSTVAGTKSYTLPSDFRFMRRLERYNTSDANEIERIRPIGFPSTEKGGEWPFGSSGKPKRYVMRGSQIDLYPIADGIYSIRIFYDKRQNTFSADSDVPTSPEDFHDLISTYAGILALQKNKEDSSVLAALYSDREQDLIRTISQRKGEDEKAVIGYLE